MKASKKIYRYLLTAFMLLLIIITAVSPTVSSFAKNNQKIVRVGWYESPFNITDKFGRRSGYAYDYQQKIAAYTGWTYEYVEGSWPELMQMLIDGKIDMMSDVSYTTERAGKMLYSSMPMGAEEYWIYVSSDNDEISLNDYSTMNGKKVGVNKNSVQKQFFIEWAKKKRN